MNKLPQLLRAQVGRQFFEWERIGSCISSSLSLVNHSCDANATRFFMGDQIVLVAIRHIAKVMLNVPFCPIRMLSG